MKALWLEKQTLSIRDIPRPDPPPGEALIRVKLAGICGTDLELLRGYYPFDGVPGHEFVGEVAACQDDPAWEGARVAGDINAACHQCAACAAGRYTHCENRTVLGIRNRNGAFAEYLTLPLENLHRVPESVSDEAAVFTEPLAAALEIQEQVDLAAATRLLLVGAGRLGLIIARSLAANGHEVEVVVRRDKQRRLLSMQGLHPIEADEVVAGGYDAVIEATGSADGFALARAAVRPRGVLILKSTYRGGVEVDLSSIVVDEITVVGSRCGPFEHALTLLEKGGVDPESLIEGRFGLNEALEAFERAAGRGVLKILLAPGDSR